ncbi:hypothetical protein TNCT_608671 [Trichonephila clavata]|uniref:Uncharacterized protein n=1 Tax=Trichonephila clavata TaxID=2740835 RepID=A0A8X6GIU4_TRICU|nr:hypothetical protein TNCT_608671 [Trichonephila clavata]
MVSNHDLENVSITGTIPSVDMILEKPKKTASSKNNDYENSFDPSEFFYLMNSGADMTEKPSTSSAVKEFATSENVLPKKKAYFFKLNNHDLQYIPITESIPSTNIILHKSRQAVPSLKNSVHKNSSKQSDFYNLPNSDADMPEELSESNNITSIAVAKRYFLDKKNSNAAVAENENPSSDDIFIKDNYEDNINNDNDYLITDGEADTIGVELVEDILVSKAPALKHNI